MSGDQLEYALMAATGLFSTLIGRAKIGDMGVPDRIRRIQQRMRWAGPVVLICGLLLLAHTSWP